MFVGKSTLEMSHITNENCPLNTQQSPTIFNHFKYCTFCFDAPNNGRCSLVLIKMGRKKKNFKLNANTSQMRIKMVQIAHVKLKPSYHTTIGIGLDGKMVVLLITYFYHLSMTQTLCVPSCQLCVLHTETHTQYSLVPDFSIHASKLFLSHHLVGCRCKVADDDGAGPWLDK